MKNSETFFGKVKVRDLVINELSANKETNMTFSRLVKEIEKHGMIQPLICKHGKDNRLVILAGHHRAKACEQLGIEEVPAVVLQDNLTKEEEFNLVNNLNVIVGSTATKDLSTIVRKFNLDVTKIDIFQSNLRGLMLPVSETIKKQTEEAKRRNAIAKLTLDIAREIATDMYDGMDKDMFCILKENKLISVIRSDMSSQDIRKFAGRIEDVINTTILEIAKKGVDKNAKKTVGQEGEGVDPCSAERGEHVTTCLRQGGDLQGSGIQDEKGGQEVFG